jgi:hypothetical protein
MKRPKTAVVLALILVAVVLTGVSIWLGTKNSATAAAPKPPSANSCVNSSGGSPVTMVRADCSQASFQVVKVVTGTNNTSACTGVAGVTNYYTFTWPSDGTQDYVLCLRKQQ